MARAYCKSGKNENFFKVREKLGKFLKSGKLFDIVKDSEKSGNLLVKSNALRTKYSQRRKEVENEEKMACKKNLNQMDCFSLIKAIKGQ